MKRIKRFAAFALMLCLLISMTSAFALADSSDLTVYFKGTNIYNEAYEVLSIINKERAANNLPALEMDEDLLEAAMQRAAECAVYYSHTRPDGSTCFTAFPSKCTGYRGENIAIGYTSAEDVMYGWMNSQGHRANILNSNFKSVGVGCFYQDGAICWVQLFCSTKASVSSTQQKNKAVTASVKISAENLNVDCDFFESDKSYLGQIEMYNVNSTFPYSTGVIFLENSNITYKSSNNRVLDITDDGIVKAYANGTADVTCYIDGTAVLEVTFEFAVDHEHEYESVVTEPTCTSGGYTTYTCTGCGHSYIANETDPVPHDYTVTEIENGHRYVCKSCGHSYEEITTPPELLMGDVNLDGAVNNLDIVLVARYIVSLVDALPGFENGDMNYDNSINNTDLVMLARVIVGNN